MAARRLLIVLLILLGLSTLAAVLVPVQQPVEDEDEASMPPPTSQQAPREPAGELVEKRIDAADVGERPRRIELARGDQLQLTVVAPEPDQVAIRALGELADVGPDTPATFDLLATDPGEFPVRLVEADRVIALLVVAPRAGEADPPGPAASLDERSNS